MSKKELKKNVKENNESRWEDVKDIYENAVKVYIMSAKAMTDIYNKYSPIIKDHPELKKILDGGSKTLNGIRALINRTALSHVEEITDDDTSGNVFVIGDKKYKFKEGVIDESNDKDVEIAVRAVIAYQQSITSIFSVVKNTLTVFLADLEKVLDKMNDDEVKRNYSKMLEADKKEYVEAVEVDNKE